MPRIYQLIDQTVLKLGEWRSFRQLAPLAQQRLVNLQLFLYHLQCFYHFIGDVDVHLLENDELNRSQTRPPELPH